MKMFRFFSISILVNLPFQTLHASAQDPTWSCEIRKAQNSVELDPLEQAFVLSSRDWITSKEIPALQGSIKVHVITKNNSTGAGVSIIFFDPNAEGNGLVLGSYTKADDNPPMTTASASYKVPNSPNAEEIKVVCKTLFLPEVPAETSNRSKSQDASNHPVLTQEKGISSAR